MIVVYVVIARSALIADAALSAFGNNKDISILENPSLCVSNEVPGESAKISFREGILICVESGD